MLFFEFKCRLIFCCFSISSQERSWMSSGGSWWPWTKWSTRNASNATGFGWTWSYWAEAEDLYFRGSVWEGEEAVRGELRWLLWVYQHWSLSVFTPSRASQGSWWSLIRCSNKRNPKLNPTKRNSCDYCVTCCAVYSCDLICFSVSLIWIIERSKKQERNSRCLASCKHKGYF